MLLEVDPTVVGRLLERRLRLYIAKKFSRTAIEFPAKENGPDVCRIFQY
jgi:hypothetical protein